jgi:hypothetical protein
MSGPRNVRNPPIHVNHSELKRWGSGESPYRSVCPVCETGPLLVCRDQTTFLLINVDRCLDCGQTVIYNDRSINNEPVAQLAKPKN